MAQNEKPSPQDQQKSAAPKGPETDPNVVGRPASIFWIYALFGLVVLLASLSGAQSSTLILRLKELWGKIAGR